MYNEELEYYITENDKLKKELENKELMLKNMEKTRSDNLYDEYKKEIEKLKETGKLKEEEYQKELELQKEKEKQNEIEYQKKIESQKQLEQAKKYKDSKENALFTKEELFILDILRDLLRKVK